MTDTLLEQIKADRENGTPKATADWSMDSHGKQKFTIRQAYADTARRNRVPDLEAAYIALTEARARDAETIKAAKALAIVAMNTECATQEDADRLAAKVAAFRAAQEKNDE